ncbi:SRPBCC family protein [Amycolatopsis sp. AA4]|uniref:SRPBCC family protein n=1 Tax=Actinomycetes TaxID=1760 RepID=UPI0001B580F8|nr:MULTISPECIES: SRPBCC family protein [Actinomycetes]ATY14304.1 SRPBCC family protein [Amycolatopsis sp. AA4]EFL10376.1 cyclase/dehydrase [Streptomyces sp. AA4]
MEWTGARYADAPTVQVDAWIDGSPEQVWRFASDVELMPELSGELQSVRWCDEGSAPALGRSFVGHNRHRMRGDWETTSYIVECEKPRVFAWAVSDPANPTAVWRFTLAPENGGTRLTQWAQMGPGPSGVTEVIARMPEKEQKIVHVRLSEFEAAMTATLGAIKDRVEAAG